MATISAVFDSPSAAHRALNELKGRGFGDSRLGCLAPGEHNAGKGTGATLGGILGMGAATFLIPGLGPVAGVGLLAGALAGVGLGAAAGTAADKKTGVSSDDLFHCENALRRGETVVLVEAAGDAEETQVRNLLEQAGGRRMDALRHEWWQTIRDQERDYIRQRGGEWHEQNYRSGFEAALQPTTRGREYDQVAAYLEECYPEPCKTSVFRIGFDRGRQYLYGRSGWQVH